MFNIKRLLALTIAAISAFSLTACKSKSDPVVTLEPVDVPDAQTTITQLPEGTTIKWMSTSDLNPAVGKERSAELTLFEDVAGGKITYISTSENAKFDDLASQILSGNGPDIFPYHWAAFPGFVTKNLFQPVDDIVDFDSPLWIDMKETAEGYAFNGKHYAAPLSFESSIAIFYNKTAIEDNGLDDPYELYLDNEWTWDSMTDIIKEYLDGDDPSNPVRNGLNGWFQSHLIQSTGQTMITYEDGIFKNNIMDPNIERAQNWLSDLARNEYILDAWIGGISPAFIDNNLLFYAMGDWASSTGNAKNLEDIEVGMVPVPRDPNNENLYNSSSMQAHLWVSGSTASEGVKAWYECNRIVQTEDQYLDVVKEKFMRDHPKHTDEMYETKMDMVDPTKFTQTFDYGYGMGTRMSVDNDSLPYEEGKSVMTRLVTDTTKQFDEGLRSWTSIRSDFNPIVDSEIQAINNDLANFNG